MNTYRVPNKLEQAGAPAAWRQTLSDVLSVFGQLVYISSLRDQNSGQYKHFELAAIFGEEEAHRAICESHRRAFWDWICFTLEQQKADLDLYLSGLEVDRKTTLETWARMAPFRNLVPTDAAEVEIDLFLADLGALLALLKNEFGIKEPA